MKIVKIQNEFKIISALTVEEINRLVAAHQNVLFEDKKPVFGIAVSEKNGSFTSKDATFNEVSDNGHAMLTMACSTDYMSQFATEAEAINAFIEANLGAIQNLKSAENAFKAVLESLNASVETLAKETKVINVE